MKHMTLLRVFGAVLALGLTLAGELSAVGGVLTAATATYSPTTSETDMNKLFRKVQGTLMEGFNFASEEYEALDSLPEFDIDWSAREITVPIDLNEGAGVASIAEGGFEAMPSSPTVDEITLAWVLFNKRFTATMTAKYIDQKSRSAQIRRQIVHQGKKAVEAIGAHTADYFYGFSTAVLAQVDDAGGTLLAATSHTIPLKNGYGLSSITGAEFIARKFKVGDRVALVQGGALVTNAIGTITARDLSTPSIDVTWGGSVDPTNNDNIVKANSQENTTLTGGTDYNRGLVGLLEMATAASVHNLATASAEEWQAAVNDSGGGRFATEDLQFAAQQVGDLGGGRITDIWMAPGVKRDIINNTASRLEFTDPFNLQLDADVKARGVRIRTTRRVPPGYLFAFDRKSIRKMTLLGKPTPGGAPTWNDGEKIPDRSAMVFSIDFPMQLVITNRRNLAVYSGLTELP